jgi:hypothetical protein
MDEFYDWTISDEEIAKIKKEQSKDPKIYDKNTCSTRLASSENCLYCRKKCS